MKIFYFFLLFCTLSSFAQNSTTDSLRLELAKPQDDTSRLNILYNLLIDHEAWENPDSTFQRATDALLYSKKIGYTKGEAQFLMTIGFCYWMKSDYNNALKYNFEALPINEKLGDHNLLWTNSIGLTSDFRDQKDYKQALKYGKINVAESLILKNSFYYNVAIANIGTIYQEMNQLDSAKFYLQKAFDDNGNGYAALELGHVYFKENNYSKALRFYREELSTSVKKDLADAYIGLANVYRATNKTDSCLIYAKKAFELGLTYKSYNNVIKAGTLLAELYKPTNLQESYKYHLLASAAKDSLFSLDKVRQSESLKFGEQVRLQDIELARTALQNKIKFYGLFACLGVFSLIAFILYRNNRQKQKANNLLQKQKEEIQNQRFELQKSLTELNAAQSQLVQKEKLASLGELTAGIAHEIQNPLNFVNNFSELSVDLSKELKEEVEKFDIPEKDKENVGEIIRDLTDNQQKINHHGKRASSIVKSMLEHSRLSTGERELTDVNKLADEYLRLSYHGLRAKDKTFNSDYRTDLDDSLPNINVVPQDIGRVLLNLINNAFWAVNEKSKQNSENYSPEVIVSTKKVGDKIEISVKDNGMGISEKIKEKIFQPFFTTKPTGEGTGLGLSLSYDIITKGHGGTLEVESTEGEGSEFIVGLSIK